MSISSFPISKTSFIKGCQCLKAFYLYRHHKEFSAEIKETAKAQKQGFKFELTTQQILKDGTNVYDANKSSSERAILTQNLILEGKSILYEACFENNSCMCATDILVKDANGWHGYEIKSSKRISYYQLLDAAYQYYVIKSTGFVLSDFSIICKEKHAIKSISILHRLEALQPLILKQIEILKTIDSSGTIPDIKMGKQCSKPYTCGFKNYCLTYIKKQ